MFADNETFLSLEKHTDAEVSDFLMFFVVEVATVVILYSARDTPRDGLNGVKKAVAAEFKKVVKRAIADQKSPEYRFLKRIEPKCRPLCLSNLIPLTEQLIEDTMQNVGVEEVLDLSRKEFEDDARTYFSLVKDVAIEFVKYFFMPRSDPICGPQCQGLTIDQIVHSHVQQTNVQ
jgi:hypothetical protein